MKPSFKGAKAQAGQIALHTMLELRRPLPATQSFVVSGARRTRETGAYIEEYYPLQYLPEETPISHLKFALKYEPLDLGVIYETFKAIGPYPLEAWLRDEPTGSFSRRAWFLYEFLTGQRLDIEDARSGNYVMALDENRHFGASPRNSQRHRVRDNLLGSPNLCPTLRRTPRLEAMQRMALSEEAIALTAQYSPETLARAINFLVKKETRSSFAIEGEAPSKNREERFLQALQSVSAFDPSDKQALLKLQAGIVDPRYAANDWRDIQNFVSETTRGFGEYVHYICPRPQDVPSLMEGWAAMTERVLSSDMDAVLAAALSAFSFVFIHPFEDGNGRIHRFLIHYALSRRRFGPPNVVLPVSTAILRQIHLYDQALEAFSKPVLSAIDWEFTSDNTVVVENDTCDLYRYFDATSQAEYLYERVTETIRQDFRDELDFLSVYDAALIRLRDIIDMPSQRETLLVKLCLQNGGRLSRSKREQFAEITDEEMLKIEEAIQPLIRSA
jgi:Fic family protein